MKSLLVSLALGAAVVVLVGGQLPPQQRGTPFRLPATPSCGHRSPSPSPRPPPGLARRVR
jgi:hypothetical protein